MVILRHIDKDEFGAYRTIIMLHMILLSVMPLGFDTLVVREKLHRLRYTMAASQALALVGGVLALLALALSLLPLPGPHSLAATVLGLGEDSAVLFFMAPIFLVQAAKLATRSLLSARMEFRTISLGEFGNGSITWLGGAAAVLLWPDAWVLMAAYLLGEVFECWWLHRNRPFRPLSATNPRRWHLFRSLFGRHRRYLLFNTADLTLNNVASLIPGVLFTALISKQANADFSVALQLLVLPTMLLAGALWRVSFPSISGLAEDELHRRCLAIIAGSAAFIAPSVIWFAVFAPSTVQVLGGSQYVETATPLVRWMALYMVLVAVYTPISSLDMIRNRPEIGLYWNIVYTAGRVAIIYHYAADGLLAAIAAQSIFSLAMWVVWAWITGRLLAASWPRFVGAVARFLPLWGGFALMLYLCLPLTGHSLLWAPILSAIPCVAYVLAIWFLYPSESAMLRKMMSRGPRNAKA